MALGLMEYDLVLSLLAAAATAAGLVVGFDGSLWSAGTLTVGNLSVLSAAAFLWHTVQHFALQEIVYRAALKNDGGF